MPSDFRQPGVRRARHGRPITKVHDGYGSLQSFSEAQKVRLKYHEDSNLIDRGTVEGVQAVQSLLEDHRASHRRFRSGSEQSAGQLRN
jgi:hypothetical protein